MTQTLPDPDSPAHQDFEVQWWGDCVNTYSEETKQISYAHRMGLLQTTLGEKWPVYDLGHKMILDVGGGPTSLLLKCLSVGHGSMVVDPGEYPDWTRARYSAAGISVVRGAAETVLPGFGNTGNMFDEAWCYNVLQHVIDPYAILTEMKRLAKRIRIFEWVNTAPSMGHPHRLDSERLNEVLGGLGNVENMNENGCVGWAYYGSFTTR